MIIHAYELLKSETEKYRYTVLFQTETVERYVILAPWEKTFNGSGMVFDSPKRAAFFLHNYPKNSRVAKVEMQETNYRNCRHKK